MNVNAMVFADRFRELAERFAAPQDVATGKAAIFADAQLRKLAGELFIDAVRHGHFRTLAGAAEIVREFDACQIRAAAGEPVSFVGGRCELWPNADARRSVCAENLFLEVAGEELVEVFNDNGELRPTRTLPPAGLLPDALRGMFPGSQFATLMLSAATAAEAADFQRLADADARDRSGLACKLLAVTLEAEGQLAQPPVLSAQQATNSPDDAEAFVPNNLQKAILAALDKCALTKQRLANKVCGGEGSRLYKQTRQGDLNELKDKGLVKNKPQLGYYRPDAPPQ